MVESQPSKLLVAGSIPVSRSKISKRPAAMVGANRFRSTEEESMAFEQAQIAVQKTEEFEQLRSAIGGVFAAGSIEKLLKKLQGKNVRIREFEKVLDEDIFEAVDSAPARSGKSAKQLYNALALSDQALIREFYLERIEQVDSKLRQRFQKVYRYY